MVRARRSPIHTRVCSPSSSRGGACRARDEGTHRMKATDREQISVAAKEPEVARRGRPVLITGGAGFIGCNVAHRLLSAGERVILYDNLSRAGVKRNVAWL